MTTHAKLADFARKPIKFDGTIVRQPVLISDSKGVYLKKDAFSVFKSICYIDFECKRGARFADYYYWLRRNLQWKVEEFGFVHLYIFLGTCDLTKLAYAVENGCRYRYIELRHQSNTSAFNYISNQIERIFLLVSDYPTVTVTFLEIPPYDIREWNRNQGHPHPEVFVAQNKILYERISILNEYIKEINEISQVKSPRFNNDLKRSRKAEGDNTKRYSLCFKEYKDGLHSGPLLSRVWMKRIILRIINECI